MLGAWDLPPLLPVKFPPPLMETLAPGCHAEVTSAPVPTWDYTYQHLTQVEPHPRCHRGVCAVRQPSRAWEKQSNFPGPLSHPEVEREGAAGSGSAPGPAPRLAHCPAQPSRIRGAWRTPAAGAHLPDLARTSPTSRSRRLTWLDPAVPAVSTPFCLCTPSSQRYRPFLGPWRVFSVWPHITSRKGERGGGGTSSPPSTSRFLLSPQGVPPPPALPLPSPHALPRPPCPPPAPQHLPTGPLSHRKVRLASFGAGLVFTAFPGKRLTAGSCFRFETQECHLQTASRSTDGLVTVAKSLPKAIF